MADNPSLPDEPGQWPSNPFELLGVPYGAAETDIKRAYTRLIRRFKPEHFPEQFRLIREAYEACLQHRLWFFPGTGTEADEPVIRPAPADEIPRDGVASAEAEVSSREDPVAPDEEAVLPAPQPLDEADGLWNAAIEGRIDEAYAGLVELAPARPERADLPLRLYWLLAAHPAVDSTRTRHFWLAESLTRSRLSGPAVELYRRELEADPVSGLYGPYIGLLSVDASPGDLLTVGRWRLEAAGRSLSWHPLRADFDVLSKRLPFENEAGWLGYLVSGLDWTSWECPPPLHALYRDEVDRLRHLELSHSHAFDRLEATEHFARAWRETIGQLQTSGLLGLVPHAWADYGRFGQGAVEPLIAAIESDPSSALYQFDRITRDHGAGLLVYLAEALEGYRQSRLLREEPEFPAELIRAAARGLQGWWRDYPEMRDELLHLLLAEALHPIEFAAACRADPDDRFQRIGDQLRRDLPLGLVWLACRIHRDGG